jgi:peptide-N4-(N-acetyl-beta-glucosaminyl)asparagine amidase
LPVALEELDTIYNMDQPELCTYSLGLYDLLYKRMFSSHNVLVSNAISNSFVLYKQISKQYVNQDILEYIRSLIPEEIVKKTRTEIEDRGSLEPILKWFKKDFMQWAPKDPKCERCNLPMSFQFINGNSWKVRKIEKYTCSNCYSVQIFPRYSSIQEIAETRIGRCSEWSMLFGALLSSLSIKTRIVHDYLDHCWNESLINGKWIHIDSTLDYPISFDHPYYYEQNWGKKYRYVLAFSSNSLDDVTKSYTQQWDIVQKRRKNSPKSLDEYAADYSKL